MTEITFHPLSEIDSFNLEFAVSCARYKGKWIFCRKKGRTTWELPGGHIERGEDGLAAAKRELYEESGAIEAEVTPVSIYGVSYDGKPFSYGLLCFAEVSSIVSIPTEFEMEEISLLDVPPAYLTYPEIIPKVMSRVNWWRNFQTSVDEIWDILDENRHPTGRTQRRGDELAKGDYHLVVHIWMRNSKGEFLLTKRSENKGYPLMWETTGGSAISGDDSITAALREVEEETGIHLSVETGKVLFTHKREEAFIDVYLFENVDIPLADINLLEGETIDKGYFSLSEVISMYESGKFVPYPYFERLLGYLYPYGYCGMACALCSRYRTEGKSKCPGCSVDGYYTEPCKVHKCLRKSEGIHCACCDEYPCKLLFPMNDFSDLNTGKIKERSGACIRSKGFLKWFTSYARKADLLTTALNRYNDGRMKRYLCELFLQNELDKLECIIEEASHLNGEPKSMAKSFKEIAEKIRN